MSHVRFHSKITQSPIQEKMIMAKIEKFSDAVTTILRGEAASKMKKLVYVFISVDQLTATSFNYSVDDSRDRISDNARKDIKARFEEIFSPASDK